MFTSSDRADMAAAEAVTGRGLTPDACFWLFAAVSASWLVAAVFLVNIDLFDGYMTAVNSQFFLGLSPEYSWQRGPLLALLLTPAEWMANRIGLHPLDVRPHHATMALLHLIYLIGVWRVIRKCHGPTTVALCAYLAAIPTLVFFSYAPFISHDIFPGLMVLVMVTVSHKFLAAPTGRDWLVLLLLGAALPLIKQTYALVWIAILVAATLQLLLTEHRNRSYVQRVGMLAGAAAVGGVFCWIAYAVLLSPRFPDAPFLLRPLESIRAVSLLYLQEGDPRDVFYQWVYARNLSAYGLAAVALLLPGLLLSLSRRASLQQYLAMVWLALVIAMNLTAFKEVRYLAFLAPLSAMLLIPVMDRLWRLRRAYRIGVVALIALNVVYVLPEMLRIGDTYYRNGFAQYLVPLDDARASSATVYYERYLSFVSPEAHAFYGDRYHRITHFSAELLGSLYGIDAARWRRLQMREFQNILQNADPADVFLMATTIVARVRPYLPGNTQGIDHRFVQTISQIENVEVVRTGAQLDIDSSSDAPIVFAIGTGTQSSIMIMGGRETIPIDSPVLQAALPIEPDRLHLRGLRVQTLCLLSGCKKFAATTHRVQP